MSNTSEYLYWDASVFLAFLQNEDGRADVIELLLEEVSRSRTLRVATSVQTIVEVTFAVKSPRPRLLSAAQEQQITDLLEAPYVRLVEVSQLMYSNARTLIRQAWGEHEWSLKPFDAVHLTTAAWLHRNVGHVRAVHSYDQKWPRYTHLIGEIEIAEPFVAQPRLKFSDEK